MSIEIGDYPRLRAEDDGFLLSLKEMVVDMHLESLGIGDCENLEECIDKLIEDSANSVDVGGMLPIYIPWRDDERVVQGSTTVPVWAGKHVGIPLYGDIAKNKVEELITGNRIMAAKLFDGFMEYSPAFRIALLVHHICQNVLIHPLAAEAFVLGRYEELSLDDEHFRKTGLPSTDLIRVEPISGMRWERIATSSHSFEGVYGNGHINGWCVRIRGSRPKESVLLESWQAIRNRLNMPRETSYTKDGRPLHILEPGISGRSRKRAGNYYVDLMVEWIDEKLAESTFPMRGTRKDWKAAAVLMDTEQPLLAGRWTPETMRKTYERRRRRGY